MTTHDELMAYIKKIDSVIKQRRYFSDNIGVPILMLKGICDYILSSDKFIITPVSMNDNRQPMNNIETDIICVIRELSLKSESKLVIFNQVLERFPKLGRFDLVTHLKSIENLGYIKRNVKREIILLD